MGEIPNTNKLIKYNGIPSTKDALIIENENMIKVVKAMDLEKILTSKLGEGIPPRLNVGKNINTVLRSADGSALKNDIFLIEKVNHTRSIYLSIDM